MKTYIVSGPFAFRGNKPGSTFEADPEDKQIHRAAGRGAITEESKSKAGASKTDNAGSAGGKE
jgi:hypothetical protein